jgi:hypothetical protein
MKYLQMDVKLQSINQSINQSWSVSNLTNHQASNIGSLQTHFPRSPTYNKITEAATTNFKVFGMTRPDLFEEVLCTLLANISNELL